MEYFAEIDRILNEYAEELNEIGGYICVPGEKYWVGKEKPVKVVNHAFEFLTNQSYDAIIPYHSITQIVINRRETEL